MNKSPLFMVSIMVIVVASIVTTGVIGLLNVTESAYADLLSKYNEMSAEYDTLSRNYERLGRERDNLTRAYNRLTERYALLDLPLKSKRMPSIRELEDWLETDTTDKYEYDDPDFACLHFSVVLMLHARAEHYDMGVVAIFGRSNETGESFSHSIGAIITTEGLVYVEPQLDKIWWLEDHAEIANGTVQRFPMSRDPIYIQEVSIFFDYA